MNIGCFEIDIALDASESADGKAVNNVSMHQTLPTEQLTDIDEELKTHFFQISQSYKTAA